MSDAEVTNLRWIPQGQTQFPVIRPYSLATDWTFQIVDREHPATVLDYPPTAIANSRRHYMVAIDDRYSVDTPYRINVYNDVPAIVAYGDFQIVRGVFDATSNTSLAQINNQLRLALGLAGLNARWQIISHDVRTGIPTEARLTVYTDETLTDILATYVMKKRLSDLGLVLGEVQFQETGQETGTTGTGS